MCIVCVNWNKLSTFKEVTATFHELGAEVSEDHLLELIERALKEKEMEGE